VVDNGLEAVERLRVESFDLVLMDLQMPVMSGIEAIREIREYDADTPVVALSADVLLYDKDSGDLDGFTGLLAKPVHTSQLRTIFEQHLHAVR
jgi:two-component system sensor histidine kinase/response regulator